MPPARYAAKTIVIAAGYYAFTELGKSLLLTGPAGAFWPSNGLGIAVLYLGGLCWWPAVLLGDLGSLLTDVLHLGLPIGPALGEAAGDLARTIVSVLILQMLVGRRISMDRLTDVGAVVIAIAAGAVISATAAMLALLAGNQISTSELGVFWRSWWLGDVSGGLVVLPIFLAWAQPISSLIRERASREGLLILAAVVGLSVGALSVNNPLTYLVFPALTWAAIRLGPQGATVALALAVVISVSITSNALGPFVEHSANGTALNLQLYITVAALTTLTVAALISERRRAGMAIANSRARIVAAADDERRRIGRDLHDGAQQQLVGLRVRLGVAEDQVGRDPASARRKIRELGAAIDNVLDDIRSLAAGIYPPELARYGLANALGSLTQRSLIPTTLEITGGSRCRPEVEAAVYFCCSEALQNTAKHARGATRASLSLEFGTGLRFVVTDDGSGFAGATREGTGLANMRERLEAVGGTLDIVSRSTGTSVTGTIALP